MFFHAKNFETILPYDQADLVAKVANQLIDEKSKVLYGRVYANGKAEDFSTTRAATDTHVALGIGVSEMHAFAPSDSPVLLDRPQQGDVVKAMEERLRLLERENKNLRESRT